MGRWFFTCLVLCAGTVGLVGWLSGAWSSDPVFPGEGPPSAGGTPSPSQAAPVPTVVHARPAGTDRFVTIPDGRLLVVDKQEVAADAEGILQFVGTEVKPGEKIAPDRQIEYYLPFLGVECDANSPDAVQFSLGVQDKRIGWKRWEPGTPIPPGKAQVLFEKRAYRKLEIGDKVKRGDTIALVNPELIGHELAIGVFNQGISESERSAAKSYLEEYAYRYEHYRGVNQGGTPRAISQEEIASIRLGRDKSAADLNAKTIGVAKSEREIIAAAAKLRMHQVQARMGGTVKMIYKQAGDAVRKLDPVVQLLNTERVRVESLVGIEQVPHLTRGMKVVVEASRPDSPVNVLPAHDQGVTCLAVSATATPVVVSGSEDRTVRGWEGTAGGSRLWTAGPFASPVRALACAPASARSPLVLIGLADGSAWLFDLSQPNQPPLELPERHKGAVNAVCFSPDGKLCATAGDDRNIVLWDVASRKRAQTCAGAHRAAVTSLTFAADDVLVSSGRDHALNAWAVNGDQPLKRVQDFAGRTGEVLVSNTDGRHVLYEQGKELRVQALKDKAFEGVLPSTSGASTFSKFALFAPDGKTILTAGTENKLQLWRTPTGGGRGAEVRQFLGSGGCNCAVFAPDGAFAVTGTADGKLLVWAMPGKDEIEKRIPATLTLVEQTIDGGLMQVRVWAELDEVPSWLVPGSSATIVVPVGKPKALSAGR